MAEQQAGESGPAIQTACDLCTQGVMDTRNPHVNGTCPCSCHGMTAQKLGGN